MLRKAPPESVRLFLHPQREMPPAIDKLERFLTLIFLRRHITYCVRRRRFAQAQGAANLHREIARTEVQSGADGEGRSAHRTTGWAASRCASRFHRCLSGSRSHPSKLRRATRWMKCPSREGVVAEKKSSSARWAWLPWTSALLAVRRGGMLKPRREPSNTRTASPRSRGGETAGAALRNRSRMGQTSPSGERGARRNCRPDRAAQPSIDMPHRPCHIVTAYKGESCRRPAKGLGRASPDRRSGV